MIVFAIKIHLNAYFILLTNILLELNTAYGAVSTGLDLANVMY